MRHSSTSWRTDGASLPLLLGLLLLPSIAQARPRTRKIPPAAAAGRKPAVKAKLAQAKQAFFLGETHFNLGRFEQALKHYSRAYELLHLPAFLFNIGQCHRKLKRFERAIFFYRGFIRKSRNRSRKRVVRRLLKRCRKKLARQKRRAAADLRAGRIPLPRLRPQGPRPGLGAALPGRGAKDKGPAIHKRWWFWTAIGAGLAAILATSLGVAYGTRTEQQLPAGSLGRIDFR